MPENPNDLDKRVRREVYEFTLRRGIPPGSANVAEALSVARQVVRDSFSRLAPAHVLVLQPESGEILMANPFSAVPTPFRVGVCGFVAYVHCIGDSFGVPAL